jgi:hypothetical protein
MTQVAIPLVVMGSLPTVVLITVAAVLFGPGRATAEMRIVVGSVDVSFEVRGETYSLAAYQIELNLSGPDDGVRFTGFAEADNAIFPGQVAIQTAGRPTLPGATAAANDILLDDENPITDGAGLLRILFESTPGSLGVHDVTADASVQRTNFSDGSGVLVTIDQFVAGTITVVPEASSLALLCGAGVLAVMIGRRRGFSRQPTLHPS